MSNYPIMGTIEESSAPWNEDIKSPQEVEVTVSITLSKTVKINVEDYRVALEERDENGDLYEIYDFSECDLKGAVEDQIILPQNAYKHVGYPLFDCASKPYKDLKDWVVDDFEVNLD